VATARVLTTAEAPSPLLAEIRRLLDSAFDGEFSDDDWVHTIGGWHAVVDEAGAMVSHAAVVGRVIHVDGAPLRAGYVEGVATAPTCRGRGLGSLAMDELGGIVRARFEMGVLSTDRHAFYERLGWERWQGPTYVRHGDDEIRTEDEDDGIMVLRFGPSAGLDLRSAIACESRIGDDW
jgi:aminoglycoside 2'-N-acetyltransferase I